MGLTRRTRVAFGRSVKAELTGPNKVALRPGVLRVLLSSVALRASSRRLKAGFVSTISAIVGPDGGAGVGGTGVAVGVGGTGVLVGVGGCRNKRGGEIQL